MTLTLDTTTDSQYGGKQIIIRDVYTYSDDGYCIALCCKTLQHLTVNNIPLNHCSLFYQFSRRDIAFLQIDTE